MQNFSRNNLRKSKFSSNSSSKITGNFTQISNKIIRNPKFSPYVKIIYIVLRSFSPSFPSYRKIMDMTGIKSKTTISNGIKILVKAGELRASKNGPYKSNFYEFPMDLDSPITGLEIVHGMDSNNTNEIKTNNNTNGSPAPPERAVEPLEYSQTFNHLVKSLGPAAKYGYKPKKRPTMNIDDPQKAV